MSQEDEAAIAAATGEGELAAVRELVLRAHPDVVPELVAGSSVGELVASVEAARAAFRRVAETVAAPGPPRVAVDVELLPAAEKIRRGLVTRR